MTVKERLIKYLKYKKISQREFAKAIDVSSGYVNSIKSSIQPDKVSRISIHFTDLNTGWLLTGEGEMLKSEPIKKEEPATIFTPKIFLVPLISKYAYAGYLSGYGDIEYIDALPQTPWLIQEETSNPRGKYFSFEVRGDSMTDGTNESVEDGDIVLCRLVDPSLYQHSKIHFKKWNFVIVHKTEGIIIKRIIDHDVEHGAITVHSLNPEYADRTIFLNDVAQIFNVVQLQRKPIL